MQRWRHYERAFDQYLRGRRCPYVATEQARDLLLPPARGQPRDEDAPLKYFDFVVYGHERNLLVELKGRRVPAPRALDEDAPSRLECWATEDDVTSLLRWEQLFGDAFRAVLVFVYWCDAPPPAPLFQEVFEFDSRWYALRAIPVREYQGAMRVRSPRWRTVDLSTADFERLSSPFAPPTPHPIPEHAGVRPSMRELATPTGDLPDPTLLVDRLLGGVRARPLAPCPTMSP
jgi:hypothetical protein